MLLEVVPDDGSPARVVDTHAPTRSLRSRMDESVQRRTSALVKAAIDALQRPQARAQVLRLIEAQPERGCTLRELRAHSRWFRGLGAEQETLLGDLRSAGLINLADVSAPGARGRRRIAWIIVDNRGDKGGLRVKARQE